MLIQTIVKRTASGMQVDGNVGRYSVIDLVFVVLTDWLEGKSAIVQSSSAEYISLKGRQALLSYEAEITGDSAEITVIMSAIAAYRTHHGHKEWAVNRYEQLNLRKSGQCPPSDNLTGFQLKRWFLLVGIASADADSLAVSERFSQNELTLNAGLYLSYHPLGSADRPSFAEFCRLNNL